MDLTTDLCSVSLPARGSEPQNYASEMLDAAEIAKNIKDLRQSKLIIFINEIPPLYLLMEVMTHHPQRHL